MPNMEQLLVRLADARVELVVVGGFAAYAHGSTRLTDDLDVCASFSKENLQRVIGALAGLRARFNTPGRKPLPSDAEDLAGYSNLYLRTDAGDLDLISSVKGVGGYEEVASRSIEVELTGRRIRVLDLDALIDAKSALKRPKDLEVLRELKEIRRRRR